MIKRPNAAGLILCRDTSVEEGTRNVTLFKAFNRLTPGAFPTPPLRFTVCTVLTDGLGDMRLTLTVDRPDTLETIYFYSWHESFTDPLRDTRFLIRVPSCRFPIPGRYLISLAADNEWVAQCSLTLHPKGG